jgi:hypothetical protein
MRYLLMIGAVLGGLFCIWLGVLAIGAPNLCESDDCDTTGFVIVGCVAVVFGVGVIGGGLYAGSVVTSRTRGDSRRG